MKKIFKIAFASLLAFSIAPSIILTTNNAQSDKVVHADEESYITSDQITFKNDSDEVVEGWPSGYILDKNILTITDESTEDYTIKITGTVETDFTIDFQRDYGRRDLYLQFKSSRGINLILTSSSSANVTFSFIHRDYGKLVISGDVIVNIVGLYNLGPSMPLNGLLKVGYFTLIDSASFIAVDPTWLDAFDKNYNIVLINYSLLIHTTGRFHVGFMTDPISQTTQSAYSFNYEGTKENFNFERCDGEFILYNKTGSRAYQFNDCGINVWDYRCENSTVELPGNRHYFQYIVEPYVISYDSNGGSGEMDFYRGRYGKITLPDCTFTAPNEKQFKCWALNSVTGTQYNAGETYEIAYKSSDVTMYAIWEDLPAAALTGTVTITGNLKYNEILTATVTDTNNSGTLSYQWRRNGDDITSATSSTYVAAEADIGYTLSVVVTSSVETGSIVGTTSDSISKADGPDAPTGITATACTTEANNDGVLKGVATDMEYKLSSSSDWIDGTGSDITGLVPGTYNVRIKATSTHYAGDITNVVVNAYNAPVLYSVTVNKGTANPVSAVAGTTITITADAPEDGYEFDKWVSSSGVVFANANSETTTFTMPEKNVVVTATYKLIPVPELDSITLSGTYKTEFEVGDTFSYDGLIVTAHYTNGGADKIVTGYVVSGPDMSTPGEKTITVTYTENEVTKTATYKINVSEKVVPPEPPVAPTSNGLSGGAVAGIVVGSILVAGIGGFALVWFVIKKKTWADFVAIFKKK